MGFITSGFRSAALTFAAILATTSSLVFASDNYIGPNNGLWTVPGNWSAGVPNSGSVDVVINSASPLTVELNSIEVVESLTLSNPDSLSLLTTLDILGNSVVNTGTILFNATASSPTLYLNANGTLSGGGTLLMSSPNSKLTGNQPRLTTDNLISGQGLINEMRIINSGTISASIGTLTIAPIVAADGLINNGSLRADGGDLLLSGSTITNTGFIDSLPNSTVNLSTTLIGGTLRSLGGSIFLGNSTFQNISLAGAAILGQSSTITLNGTISSAATVTLSTSANLILNNATFNNNGLLSLAGASIQLAGGFTGSGTLSVTSAGGTLTGSAGKAAFSSNIITGPGILKLSGVTLTNTGSIAAPLTLISTDLINKTFIQLPSGGSINLGSNSTLSGGGTIFLAATNTVTGSLGQNLVSDNRFQGAGTIGNNFVKITNIGTILAFNGLLTLNPVVASDGMVNMGTIASDNAGTLNASGINIANAGGTIQALAGASIIASSATINGGTLLAYGSGSISLSASTVANATIGGYFTNAMTLSLASVTSSFIQSGNSSAMGISSSISNCTLSAIVSSSLNVGGPVFGSLLQTDASSTVQILNNAVVSNSTISGAIAAPSGIFSLNNVFFSSGTTVTANAALNANAVTFNNATYTANANIVGSGSSPFSGAATIILNRSASLVVSGSTTFYLESGLVIRANAQSTESVVSASTTTLENHAVLSAENPNTSLTVFGTINNYGTIQAINGGYVILRGNLNNFGTISNLNSVLVLDLPNLTLDSLAGFVNQGVIAFGFRTLDNTDATMTLSSATGPFGLYSTNITGGLITSPDQTPLHILQNPNPQITNHALTNTLTGVTLAANVVVHENASLALQNTLTLAGATITLGGTGEAPQSIGRSIFFADGSPLLGTGTIVFNSNSSAIGLANGATLTLGPGILVETGSTGGAIGAPAVNQGTILSQTAGMTITLAARTTLTNGSSGVGPFLNQGLISASNGGSLAFAFAASNSGTITINQGAASFTSSLTNSGSLTISSGTLAVTGLVNSGLVSAANSTFTLQGVVGDGQFVNTGTTSLQNTVLNDAVLLAGYTLGNFTHTGPTVLTATVPSSVTHIDLSATPFGPADLGGAFFQFNTTISASSSTPVLRSDFGILNVYNATFATNLVMLAGSTLMTGGTNIYFANSSISMLSSATTSTRCILVDVLGNGQLVFNGLGSNNTIQSQIITSGIAIRTGTGGGSIAPAFADTLLNNGTISAETAGQTITIGSISNAGFLNASNGGVLSFTGNFANSGLFSLTGVNASVVAAPNLAFVNSGSISLTNASLNATSWSNAGTVSLAGSTLTVAYVFPSSTLPLTNSGFMTIGANSTAFILPANTGGFTNTGTLIADGGTIVLGNGTHSVSGSLITLNGGAVILNGALQIGNGGTTGSLSGTGLITNNAALAFNRTDALVISNAISGIGSLTQSGTGITTLSGPYTATGPISITAGKLAFASTTAPRQTPAVMLSMQNLSISSGGSLDSTNHDLLIGNTTLPNVETKILAGFGVLPNGNPSSPTDPVITSSTLQANGNTFLVPIDADSILGDGTPGSAIGQTWDNVSITQPGTVIVKYTYEGDSDLNGQVDFGDYSSILSNFGKTTPGLANIEVSWLMGDLDFNGKVDFGDYSPIISTFGDGVGNPLGGLDSSPATVSGGGSFNVPEPASLVLLGIGAAGLLIRRKRR